MADLAIQCHATRGDEVIEILEMLGGKNKVGLFAKNETLVYFRKNGVINNTCMNPQTLPFKTFTLEEFLEKFPYKVGDKVSSKYLKNYEVSKMEWESANNRVIYKLKGMGWYSADELQPYKEAPMYLNEKANKQAEEIKKILEPVKEIMEEIKLDIPDGYEFFGIDDDNKVVLTKKQPQYPETYEECCKILCCKPIVGFAGLDDDEENLYGNFIALKRCRDAYWKIAGDWKSDYINPTKESMYFIFCNGTNIEKGQGLYPINKVLIFPTEEMRDAFYENFKGLIEMCKELL